jgi:adenine-specific DNA glycosylase
VLTFAFGRTQVLIDRATTRIAGRIVRHDDTRRFQLRLDLHRLAGPQGPDAEFNRALLDLGRDVCRVVDPSCHHCPLVGRCVHGRQVARQLVLTSADELEGVAA